MRKNFFFLVSFYIFAFALPVWAGTPHNEAAITAGVSEETLLSIGVRQEYPTPAYAAQPIVWIRWFARKRVQSRAPAPVEVRKKAIRAVQRYLALNRMCLIHGTTCNKENREQLAYLARMLEHTVRFWFEKDFSRILEN